MFFFFDCLNKLFIIRICFIIEIFLFLINHVKHQAIFLVEKNFFLLRRRNLNLLLMWKKLRPQRNHHWAVLKTENVFSCSVVFCLFWKKKIQKLNKCLHTMFVGLLGYIFFYNNRNLRVKKCAIYINQKGYCIWKSIVTCIYFEEILRLAMFWNLWRLFLWKFYKYCTLDFFFYLIKYRFFIFPLVYLYPYSTLCVSILRAVKVTQYYITEYKSYLFCITGY